MNYSLLRWQGWILFVGVILMAVKFVAWYFSHSNAILTDALESIVNVVAAAFTLFSLYLSFKPKDKDHPYGHGKIEYIAAGIEGGLIGLAGLYMIIKASLAFKSGHHLHQLEEGIVLVTAAGIINYLMGFYMVRKGKEIRSVSMVAGGKHLISDGYTSLGMILGLAMVFLSGKIWIDHVMAILLGCILIFSCVSIIRKSIAGIMDETDVEIIGEIIDVLKSERKEIWIDIHNLRVIKYGTSLHIDCHVTLPWYLNLQQAHDEMDCIQKAVEKKFKNGVEFFIHNDPCLPDSCSVCKIKNCEVRKSDFIKEVEWNSENLLANQKHRIK